MFDDLETVEQAWSKIFEEDPEPSLSIKMGYECLDLSDFDLNDALADFPDLKAEITLAWLDSRFNRLDFLPVEEFDRAAVALDAV